MKKVKQLIVSGISLSLLYGCGLVESAPDLESIGEASENLAEVENGLYTYTYSTTQAEEEVMQRANGMFESLDGTVNWKTVLKMQEAATDYYMATEMVQKDGIVYERLGRMNEENSYINASDNVTEAPDWQERETEATAYPQYLEVMMDLDLEDEQFAESEVTEENEQTIYTFQHSQEYLDKVKQANIEQLTEQLEAAREQGDQEELALSLESALAYQNNLTFEEGTVTLTVDESNVLVGHELESTILNENDAEEPRQMTVISTIEVTEYNQQNFEGIDF